MSSLPTLITRGRPSGSAPKIVSRPCGSEWVVTRPRGLWYRKSRVRSCARKGVPSTERRSAELTFSAGEVITAPLTDTRPAAIQASASRREARPARAITLAIRSPVTTCSSVLSAIEDLRCNGACHRRLLSRFVYKDVDARHKAGHDSIVSHVFFHADRA